MSKNKFYAVRVGRHTGVYLSWSECEKQIKGYSNATYKKFDTIEEAEKYVKNKSKKNKSKKPKNKKQSFKRDEVKQNKRNKKELEIIQAEKELKNQFMHYKDKPVNGDPTDRQIDYLKALVKKNNLKISIIGINKREAAELINYFLNESLEAEKPKCFNKYINLQ